MTSKKLIHVSRLFPTVDLTSHHTKNPYNNPSCTANIFKCSSGVASKHTGPPSICPKRSPCKPEKKPSFLSSLWRGKKGKKGPLPPKECCRLPQPECPPDIDESMYDGKAFKTCGPAYIIQKDVLPREQCKLSPEEKTLKAIQANFGVKANADDPMPAFTTVEQRMMDLDRRRLHPLYRVYQNVPKKRMPRLPQKDIYKTISGPFSDKDIPKQFKFNTKLLEKKNMFADYKRVEPPQQLVAKLVELRKNEKPTVRRKIPVVPQDAQPTETTVSHKSNIFDTLYQGETKF